MMDLITTNIRPKWSLLEFGDFVERVSQKYNPELEDEDLPCVELEHIEQGTGSLKGYTNAKAQASIKNVFKLGDVLFGKLRPYLKKYLLASFDGVCSSEIWVLKGKSGKCHSRYLYYLVQQHKFIELCNKTAGSKMPRADWSLVEAAPFAIPPLPEQQKIANILGTWDELIAQQSALITAKEKRKKGLMQQLLSGKVRFPGFEGDWETRMLGECVEGKGDYGINAAGIARDSRLPVYLRITDISEDGEIDLNEMISVDNPSADKFELAHNDIVFARTGASVGKSYLHDSHKNGKMVFAGFLIRFKLNAKVLLPQYLKNYVETIEYWNWVAMVSQRSGQPGINSNEYSQLKLPVPSITEQMQIIKILDECRNEIQLLKLQLSQLNLQKKGLIQQLLTGDVN